MNDIKPSDAYMAAYRRWKDRALDMVEVMMQQLREETLARPRDEVAAEWDEGLSPPTFSGLLDGLQCSLVKGVLAMKGVHRKHRSELDNRIEMAISRYLNALPDEAYKDDEDDEELE